MGIFNPDQLSMLEVQESFDTTFVGLPPGDYPFSIDELEIREVESENAQGGSFFVMEVKCTTPGTSITPTGETVQAVTGRERASAKYKCFLDMERVDGGPPRWKLGKGMNVDLGKLRAATGLNIPGQPFNPLMLKGRTFIGTSVNVPDRKDPSKVYPEIRNPRAQ